MTKARFSAEMRRCIKNCMARGAKPRSDIARGFKKMGCVKTCRKRAGKRRRKR